MTNPNGEKELIGTNVKSLAQGDSPKLERKQFIDDQAMMIYSNNPTGIGEEN